MINVPSLETIEIWNNSTQRAKMRKKLESNITNHENRNQNKGLLYTPNINFQFSQDYKCPIIKRKIYVTQKISQTNEEKIILRILEERKKSVVQKIIERSRRKKRTGITEKI